MRGVSGVLAWLFQDGARWRPYPPPEAGCDSKRRSTASHAVRAGGSRHALIAVNRVTGTLVFDVEGRLCGQIRDLSVEKETGRIIFALISFGGPVGFDVRLLPLPWGILRYDVNREGYAIPLRTSDLREAPSLAQDELEFFGAGDAAWRSRVAAYYGALIGAPAL